MNRKNKLTLRMILGGVLLKDLIYKIVLPVYLWSIGFSTLKDYVSALERDVLIRTIREFKQQGTGIGRKGKEYPPTLENYIKELEEYYI